MIEQTSRGTGLQHINQTTFWPLTFPLPPLNEQKRIVAKLDKIIPRIAAVKERLDKIPAIVKRFRQSVLIAAVMRFGRGTALTQIALRFGQLRIATNVITKGHTEHEKQIFYSWIFLFDQLSRASSIQSLV